LRCLDVKPLSLTYDTGEMTVTDFKYSNDINNMRPWNIFLIKRYFKLNYFKLTDI